jgi:hypothetical protein
MIKTREQLLDEIERETLAKVRDLLRRGSALFEGTPEWDPPKEPDGETPDEPSTENAQEWCDFAGRQKDHADALNDYAASLHTALEQLHAELVDFESESAQALVDFDSLTRQYDIPILPIKGA